MMQNTSRICRHLFHGRPSRDKLTTTVYTKGNAIHARKEIQDFCHVSPPPPFTPDPPTHPPFILVTPAASHPSRHSPTSPHHSHTRGALGSHHSWKRSLSRDSQYLLPHASQLEHAAPPVSAGACSAFLVPSFTPTR